MSMILRISGTISDSTNMPDGLGRRFVIMTQGCHHNCKGCHNPQNHDPTQGKSVDIDTLFDEIKSIPSELIDGVTFSGGEPFLQAGVLATLGRRVKEELGLNIITYTGYTFEEILAETKTPNSLDWLRLISVSDFLIDGRYDEEKKSDDYIFASTNQRFINCKESLIRNEAIESDLIKFKEPPIDESQNLSDPINTESVYGAISSVIENVVDPLIHYVGTMISMPDSDIENIKDPEMKKMVIKSKKICQQYVDKLK